MYPQFKLYLQDGGRFLLAARRRKKSKTSNFLISLESDDLARKGGGYHSDESVANRDSRVLARRDLKWSLNDEQIPNPSARL
jgi:hypothetical protein